MSVTVKDQGVTVVTVASDSKSMFPPLCQILKALCHSPVCCSVQEGLMQSGSVSALGTVQIMVGLFNIGLGPGRTSTHPEDLTDLKAAYWLGAVFIVAGIISVLADCYPSVCSVGFIVLVNIIGSIFAIIGIALYAKDLRGTSLYEMCNDQDYDCESVAYFAQRLLTGMDITLIVMAVLQLCVSVALAVLSMRPLLVGRKAEGGRGVDIAQPLLKEVLLTSPGA